MHIQQCDLKAFLFQCIECMQNRMMLKCGRDNMLFALFGAERRGSAQCLIIGFAAAGCKRDLFRIGVQAACNAAAGIFQRLFCLLPECIKA